MIPLCRKKANRAKWIENGQNLIASIRRATSTLDNSSLLMERISQHLTSHVGEEMEDREFVNLLFHQSFA